MKNFYIIILVASLITFNSLTSSHAGLISTLLGFGDYETCVIDELKKATTSKEIKNANDYCRKQYPNADTLSASTTNNVPVVEIPVVPSAELPLLPVVPIPKK